MSTNVSARKSLIYEVKWSICEAIYIGNTQKQFKIRMDGHFSDLLRLIKNWQKYDLFAAHFKHNFKSTTSRTYLCKCMEFKVVKHLNLIGAMKTFKKPNCNLCTEERLTTPKKPRDECARLMKNN